MDEMEDFQYLNNQIQNLQIQEEKDEDLADGQSSTCVQKE